MTAAYAVFPLKIGQWAPEPLPPRAESKPPPNQAMFHSRGILNATVVVSFVVIDARFGDTVTVPRLSGEGTLTVTTDAHITPAADPALSGGGVLSAAAHAVQPIGPAMGGDGALTVEFNAVPAKPHEMSVDLSGAGALAATAANTFVPFTEENIDRVNYPVPMGHSGCWVTLVGGGGSGGDGDGGVFSVRGGGGGGGGGGLVQRSFIAASEMGPTYTVTRGRGGALAAGTKSHFASGLNTIDVHGGGLRRPRRGRRRVGRCGRDGGGRRVHRHHRHHRRRRQPWLVGERARQ